MAAAPVAPAPAPTVALAPQPSSAGLEAPQNAEATARDGPTQHVTFVLLDSAPVELVAAVVPPVVKSSVTVALEFGRAGQGWAGAIVFHVWLRRQLRERRMTQRQLATFAGINHSTISRLLRGDRTPSLDTAAKLAHALRKLGDDEEVVSYFDREANAVIFPTQRVEAALLGDEELDDDDVRRLMETYLHARRERMQRRSANGRAVRVRAGG